MLEILELMAMTGTIVFVLWYFFDAKERDGYVYARFPFAHSNTFGSLPNPKEIKRGYRWTPAGFLKKKFKEDEKHRAFIDYFRFDEDYVVESKMNKTAKKSAEKVKIHFDPIDMRQGVLIVGKMGAGKTELYFSILKQKFYSRAVIHQVKAGDFVEVFLRKRDMLFSPYDERGYIWDILSEKEGIIKTFFENYANALMGDKKDFFSATANRLYNELAQKIRTEYKDETAAKKWLLFIKSIKDLFLEMDSGSQNSKKDVKGTMEAIIEPLELMAWKMQNPKQKSFVIKDFFAKKNQTKLILDNIPEYEKSLTPLFSAFTACLSQIHTSMPDSITDFTLYALDEYLSLAAVMDEPSKKRLHTLIRSKGGILMPAVQYIPTNDKKMQQLLTSSAYTWIYFSVIEESTIKLLKDSIGETEFVKNDVSENHSEGKKSKNYSSKVEKTHLIYNELLNGLGAQYEHITYIPNEKVLYKGYTPRVELKKITKKQVEVDLSPFYAMKYANENRDEEALKNLTFADLFKEKPLSKIDEYKLFKKLQMSKKQGEKALENFKKDNGLTTVNLDFLFKKWMPNKTVISNKMKMYSLDERLKLFEDWLKIKGDEEKELEFIEQNELQGALPNFFDDLAEIVAEEA